MFIAVGVVVPLVLIGIIAGLGIGYIHVYYKKKKWPVNESK